MSRARTDAVRKRERAYKKAWHEKYPNWQRDHDLWRHFKLTPAAWDSMLVEQGHRCAICRVANAGGRWDTWHVDHCHATDKVRGLLCDKCNRGLGFFVDSPEYLRAAAIYLERAECQTPTNDNSTQPTQPMAGPTKPLLHIVPKEKPPTDSSVETQSQNSNAPNRKSA